MMDEREEHLITQKRALTQQVTLLREAVGGLWDDEVLSKVYRIVTKINTLLQIQIPRHIGGEWIDLRDDEGRIIRINCNHISAIQNDCDVYLSNGFHVFLDQESCNLLRKSMGNVQNRGAPLK